mmetsp:Transcript_37693/g.90084  ORF Transcript_37693/g.90084 Transcript_37693/m.90084 type:complete len:130 (-) Transcript_37693:1975-2364(-)
MQLANEWAGRTSLQRIARLSKHQSVGTCPINGGSAKASRGGEKSPPRLIAEISARSMRTSLISSAISSLDSDVGPGRASVFDLCRKPETRRMAVSESSTIGGAGGSSSEEDTARIRATFEGFRKLRKKH